MDIIPFFRYVGALICFGMCFYILGTMLTGMTDLIPFDGIYPSALMTLWMVLPAVVLFFGGIKLVMVQQKRGG